MTPQQLRLARARGYDVLAQLLLHGATKVEPDAIAAIASKATDPDELSAQYVAAFDLGVAPYASAFLEPSGRVGGSVTRAASDAIHRDGFGPVTDEVAACHLGVLLGHVAQLCRSGRDAAAARFAQTHVLSWLPSYVAALEELEDVPFWTAVVQVALDLVAEHVRSAALPRPPIGLELAQDHPLRDPDAGLRAVSTYLASPARCGLFVTDAELGRIGRALNLPRGFGPRRARIETLVRAAASYDAIMPLCAALTELANRRRCRLTGLAEGGIEGRLLRGWTAKIETTLSMLATLHSGAASVATPTGSER